MRRVARSVGASLATVQLHFATKDDLWRGAVDSFLDDLPAIDQPRSDHPLRDGVATILAFGIERPGLITAVLCDRAPGHVDRFAYIADRVRDRHQAFHAVIVAARDQGLSRDFDAQALLLLLNIGLGSIASAPTAAKEIYGFDLHDSAERDRLSAALGDILRASIQGDGRDLSARSDPTPDPGS